MWLNKETTGSFSKFGPQMETLANAEYPTTSETNMQSEILTLGHRGCLAFHLFSNHAPNFCVCGMRSTANRIEPDSHNLLMVLRSKVLAFGQYLQEYIPTTWGQSLHPWISSIMVSFTVTCSSDLTCSCGCKNSSRKNTCHACWIRILFWLKHISISMTASHCMFFYPGRLLAGGRWSCGEIVWC